MRVLSRGGLGWPANWPTCQPLWWLQNTVCWYLSSLFRVQWFKRGWYDFVSIYARVHTRRNRIVPKFSCLRDSNAHVQSGSEPFYLFTQGRNGTVVYHFNFRITFFSGPVFGLELIRFDLERCHMKATPLRTNFREGTVRLLTRANGATENFGKRHSWVTSDNRKNY